MATALEMPSNGIHGNDITADTHSKVDGEASTSVLAPVADTSEWQWLFSPADLEHTPSVLQSGLTSQEERGSRWRGAQLIFRIGDYMRLGNHVTATATIFFHRFYMRKSMPGERGSNSQSSFPYQEMAPTCIFLACKVEETHRKLHSIVEATMAMMDRSPEGQQRADARMYRVDTNSQDYRRWKNIVLLREERLLAALCFDLIVEQPHPIAIKACRLLGTDRELARLTILLLNCFLHGAVCTFFDAATLAAAAFSKACQYVELDPQGLSAQRPWTDAFDVDQEEVDEAMPLINEYLEYHHSRVQQQQRADPQPHYTTGSAKSSKASTPAVSQHTTLEKSKSSSNLAAGTDDADPRIDGTPYRDGKRAHFCRGDDEGATGRSSAMGERGDGSTSRHWESPRFHSSQGGTTGPHVTPRAPEWSERETEHTNAPVRPISRHGARDGQPGPPPPLAAQSSGNDAGASSSAAPHVLQSPKLTHDDVWRPSMDRHRPPPPRHSPHDARGPASHRDEVHQKIAHEQAQQESHVLLSPKLHSPGRHKMTGNESDEEGAW